MKRFKVNYVLKDKDGSLHDFEVIWARDHVSTVIKNVKGIAKNSNYKVESIDIEELEDTGDSDSDRYFPITDR